MLSSARIYIFSLLVCAIHPLIAQNPDYSKDIEQLQYALKQHDQARIEFRYKMETGYIRGADKGDIAVSAQKRDFLYGSSTAMVERIQRHLRSLDPRGRTLALIYELAEDRPGVWLVTPNSVIYGGQSHIREAAVELGDELGLATRMATRMPVRRTSGATGDSISVEVQITDSLPGRGLSKLSRALLTPKIWSYLTSFGQGQLLILPVHNLGSVPFSILPLANDRALIESFRPIILPGVDGLFFWVKMMDNYSGRNSLIVGDPDLTNDPEWDFIPLPGARVEALAVAGMLNTIPLIGEYATYDKVLSEIYGKSLIYFATHGIADSKNPMDSSFLALKNSHLRAAQIKRFQFHSRHPLIIMSACQTGLGKTFDGGVFGLSRAWIHSGAAQVLASQWSVDDAATAYMMKQFMHSVQRERNTMQAYQKAILQCRTRYPDPLLWGSFNLFGYPQPIRTNY